MPRNRPAAGQRDIRTPLWGKYEKRTTAHAKPLLTEWEPERLSSLPKHVLRKVTPAAHMSRSAIFICGGCAKMGAERTAYCEMLSGDKRMAACARACQFMPKHMSVKKVNRRSETR
jgi:hypothetical protein